LSEIFRRGSIVVTSPETKPVVGQAYVVIQGDDAVESPMTILVPLIRKVDIAVESDDPRIVKISRTESRLDVETVADCGFIETLPKTEIDRQIGTAEPATLEALDEALRFSLGLRERPQARFL